MSNIAIKPPYSKKQSLAGKRTKCVREGMLKWFDYEL